MKKLFYILLALLVFAGCDKEEQQLQKVNKDAPVFTTSFEDYVLDEKTKTYVDANVKLLWHEADEISIFTTTKMFKYLFDGKTGDNNGAFNLVGPNDQFVTGNSISANYAVYPYSSENAMSNDEVISLTLPATQQYAQNSFGRGANTMVAVTSGLNDYFLPFKNIGGYLLLKLYAEDVTVKSIYLTGNNGEKLAGDATVTAQYGKSPVIEMAGTATETIALDCGEGIKLGTSKEDPTLFWIVVPPTLFEKGFTVTVTDTRGCTMKKSTSKIFNLERNKVNTMSAFEVNDLSAPSNEIWYTSSDGAVVEPNAKDVFGANITSNTYVNGQGVITFDAPVTSVGENAFKLCSRLVSITLPEGVTSLGAYAFNGCDYLESFDIPEGVTSIGAYTFAYCLSLLSITIPEGVTSIGDDAFNQCQSLGSVTLPEGVTSIGAEAFYACTSLNSITIPESVTAIGNSAFLTCLGLENIYCNPSNPPALGTSVFDENASGRLIHVPAASESDYKQATNWSDYADAIVGETVVQKSNEIWYTSYDGAVVEPYAKDVFGANITSNTYANGQGVITFDAPVTSVGENAFKLCSRLVSITLPKGVTSLGAYAFHGCDYLESFDIPEGVTSIGANTFLYCLSLLSITIPEGVTSIGDYAFSNCSSLDSITLPEGVTFIGAEAFCATSLNSITIPESVTAIGDGAFRDCLGLENIYCNPSNPPTLGTGAFAYTSLGVESIYVPTASESAYKQATNWSNYASFIKGML